MELIWHLQPDVKVNQNRSSITLKVLNLPQSRPKPKRVSQVNEHESENVEHEEYTEQDDDQVSDDDPRVDFATFAVNYHAIDTRYNTHHSYSDESSDDESSNNKYKVRHRK